jgi:DNA-binding LacI/PurR family transcriptional regulator
MGSAQHLEEYLESLAMQARPGDRLPTVRRLMAEFDVSQAVVQRITDRLKAEGRISAETGRGTFFVGGEAAAAPAAESKARGEQRSVLFLRRATSLQRGRRVLEVLHQRLQAENCRVVEVSYTDSRDALEILRNLPRFDACVIQSTFETISIEMLAAVRRKAAAIVVDGAVLAGTEVDAVGIEWGSAVELALNHLRALGHRRIALVLGSHFVLATEIGRIWFQARMATEPESGTVIKVPAWPHEDYAQMAAEAIAAQHRQSGAGRFTALIVWGVESGTAFTASLQKHGLEVPRDLSVVLLGRTDLANEHGDFYSICGTTTQAQANALFEAVRARWDEPMAEYRITYLPLSLTERRSVGSAETAVATASPET